ncbi:MAG TPA: MFS transporter [Candidatus Binataceae bacterium]|nr:MFS transporter [Candidatus Binataceae bacterium]
MSASAPAGAPETDSSRAPAARAGFFGYSRNFWLVFWATFALNLSSNLFVLFPVFLVGLGADAGTIGAVIGTFSLAALAGRPAVGWLLDRNGHQRTAAWLLVLDVFVMVLYLTLHQLGWSIYGVRALHGLVEGTARVALFAMVYELLPEGRAGEAMAMFSLCGMGSAGLSPIFGEWVIKHSGFPAFFASAIALTLVAALAARMLPDDRAAVRALAASRPANGGPGYATLLRDPALAPLWIVTLLFSLSISSRVSFVAPYAYQRGLSQVGSYFAIYAGMAVVIRAVGSRLMDRVGLERMVPPSLLVLAVGMAMIAGSGMFGMLEFSAVVGGLGHGYLYPVLSALVILRTQTNATGRSASIYSSLYDLGGMMGPYALGATANFLGYGPTFLISGALALAGGLYFAAVEPEAFRRRLA